MMNDTMNRRPTHVFISYSHDSEAHEDRVLQFSQQLRTEGVDARIDRYEQSPPKGWPRWCLRQAQEAEFVLVVCTKIYKRRFDGKEALGKGRGVAFESNIVIQIIYEDQARNKKFIPITFRDEDLEFIPLILRGSSFYNVYHVREYQDLYRRLTHQPPTVSPSPLGTVRTAPMTALRSAGPAAIERPQLGVVRVLSAMDATRVPEGLAVPLSMTAARPQAETVPARQRAQGAPTICATFELNNGRPVVKGDSYKIWVGVRDAPEGTEKVNYEILDETFPKPKFAVKWGKRDFADWITSYGDIFLTAKGKGNAGAWRTQTTLLDALKAGYRGNPPKATIRKAIEDIANN